MLAFRASLVNPRPVTKLSAQFRTSRVFSTVEGEPSIVEPVTKPHRASFKRDQLQRCFYPWAQKAENISADNAHLLDQPLHGSFSPRSRSDADYISSEATMKYGKYQGQRQTEIPTSYIKWILDVGDLYDKPVMRRVFGLMGKSRYILPFHYPNQFVQDTTTLEELDTYGCGKYASSEALLHYSARYTLTRLFMDVKKQDKADKLEETDEQNKLQKKFLADIDFEFLSGHGAITMKHKKLEDLSFQLKQCYEVFPLQGNHSNQLLGITRCAVICVLYTFASQFRNGLVCDLFMKKLQVEQQRLCTLHGIGKGKVLAEVSVEHQPYIFDPRNNVHIIEVRKLLHSTSQMQVRSGDTEGSIYTRKGVSKALAQSLAIDDVSEKSAFSSRQAIYSIGENPGSLMDVYERLQNQNWHPIEAYRDMGKCRSFMNTHNLIYLHGLSLNFTNHRKAHDRVLLMQLGLVDGKGEEKCINVKPNIDFGEALLKNVNQAEKSFFRFWTTGMDASSACQDQIQWVFNGVTRIRHHTVFLNNLCISPEEAVVIPTAIKKKPINPSKRKSRNNLCVETLMTSMRTQFYERVHDSQLPDVTPVEASESEYEWIEVSASEEEEVEFIDTVFEPQEEIEHVEQDLSNPLYFVLLGGKSNVLPALDILLRDTQATIWDDAVKYIDPEDLFRVLDQHHPEGNAFSLRNQFLHSGILIIDLSAILRRYTSLSTPEHIVSWSLANLHAWATNTKPMNITDSLVGAHKQKDIFESNSHIGAYCRSEVHRIQQYVHDNYSVSKAEYQFPADQNLNKTEFLQECYRDIPESLKPSQELLNITNTYKSVYQHPANYQTIEEDVERDVNQEFIHSRRKERSKVLSVVDNAIGVHKKL